uniref:ATP synthase complex subunit 8 n=1 Tax=Diploprion bifasciatus TaxID=3354454 RepID=A0A0U1ZVP2_DIPBI|nr:ATP synthase F0 subunit 8 [Diploprion bifasciatum]AKA59695.1 ATP synthase F0 subunit 8 [Diploprion bifasciatum]
MPQLNPAPWFAILVFSWLVFIIVIPSKVTAHTFPKTPSTQTTIKQKPESWVWPWY